MIAIISDQLVGHQPFTSIATYLFLGTPAVGRSLLHHFHPTCQHRQSPRLHYNRTRLSPHHCSVHQPNEQHRLYSWHQRLENTTLRLDYPHSQAPLSFPSVAVCMWGEPWNKAKAKLQWPMAHGHNNI